MEELKEYPTNIIRGLPYLWVFGMNYGPSDHQLLKFLKALDNLDQLNETSIYVQSELTFLLNSKNLLSSARYLRLNVIDSELISLSHRKARSLEALQIYDSKLRTLKLSNPTMDEYWNLQHVIISRCKYLQDLDCLVYAPFLKNIWVSQCGVLQRIIRIDNMDANRRLHVNVFSSLKRIRLDDLPCLEYICNIPLRFPSLERIYISKCSKLLELPFTDISAKNCLQLIKGHQNWWNELSWRDDNLRQHFFPYFRKWTLPRVGLPLHKPWLVSSGIWPESKSNIPSHFLTTSRLHILR